jgi:hypothetical protein
VTRVDILSVLTRDMHMSPRAAKCVLSHGQVYLDEHQLGPGDFGRRRPRRDARRVPARPESLQAHRLTDAG